MSSSGIYDYSYIDLELAERRVQRKQLAELLAQADLLREQARRLAGRHVTVGAPAVEAPGEDADSTVLREAVEQAGAALRDTRQRVDRLFTETLLADLTAPARQTRQTKRIKGVRSPDRPAPALATATPELELVRTDCYERAVRLLTDDGPRCEPEDLAELTDLLGTLREARSVEVTRRAFGEVEHRVARSIQRRRVREEDVLARARMRTLAGQASAERRAELLAAIESEADVGALTDRITKAVQDAERAALPATVSAIAADALAAIGCDVGPQFATAFAGEGAVVGLGDGWPDDRYALLVKMEARDGRLLTAVVRKDGTTADPAADTEAQRRFCDKELAERLRDRMADEGVTLHERRRLEPGMLPVAAVSPERWPGQGARPKTRKRTPAAQPVTQQRPRERRRER